MPGVFADRDVSNQANSMFEFYLRLTARMIVTLARMTVNEKTVKLLALGIHQLDFEALKTAVQGARFLFAAGHESTRNGDGNFLISAAFWDDEVTDYPWWGMLKVASMDNRTQKPRPVLFTRPSLTSSRSLCNGAYTSSARTLPQSRQRIEAA